MSTEPILEPDLPIVDPHHHLWDRPKEVLRNLPPIEHGFMDIIREVPRYLLDELLADVKSGHNVKGTIYMECGAMYRADGPELLRSVGETEFVNGIAAMTASGLYGDVRACAGIVAMSICAKVRWWKTRCARISRRGTGAFAASATAHPMTTIRWC
jgi:predicted TIM-barrel fold metal-dependent hydrolase